MEQRHEKLRKNFKICFGVTLLLSIILIIVSITMFHTILKPKKPQIILHPISLDEIESQIISRLSLNVTLELIITIKNPNYGSFKFDDSIAPLIYHGNNSVGEIIIEHGRVPSKGELTTRSYADIIGDKLIESPYFMKDIEARSLNFTSNLTLHGKVKMLKIFKMHATVTSYCEISVLVHSHFAIQLCCHSKVRL